MPKPPEQDKKNLNITGNDIFHSKESTLRFPRVEEINPIETDESYDVFICYRRIDAVCADAVYNMLKASGYSVYRDTCDKEDGDYLNRSIHFVKNCKDFIIICTDGCMEWRTEGTDVFYNEIWHAVKEGKNNIPALMSDTFSFPSETPDGGYRFKENWKKLIYRNVKIYDKHDPQPFYDDIINHLSSKPAYTRNILKKCYYSPCLDSTMLMKMGIIFNEEEKEREFLNSLSDTFINEIVEFFNDDISQDDLDTIKSGSCENSIAWLTNKYPDWEKDIAAINRNVRKKKCLDELDTSTDGFVQRKSLKKNRAQIESIKLSKRIKNTLNELGFLTVGEYASIKNLNEFSDISKDIQDKISAAIEDYEEKEKTEEEARKKTAEDQAIAKKVVDKISRLDDITLASEDTISSLKKHYDDLTPDQKKLVSNYNILVKADKTLSRLKDEQKDKLEADKVESEIGKLAGASRCSEKAIANARHNYNNLKPKQQKLVSNYNLLVYQEGLTFHENGGIKEAFEKFKESADLDNVNAMICVGSYYASGFDGLKADISKASNWYNKALKTDPNNDTAKKCLIDLMKPENMIIRDRNTISNKKDFKVGDIVTFGKYYQNNSNTKDDIEWRVLAKEENKILLISKYGLDCQQYSYVITSDTWETCSLRYWLNNYFFKDAFDSNEQAIIAETKVIADANPNRSTTIGNDTTDKVFLLSITEAKKYFNSFKDRICKPTPYAKGKGAWSSVNGECWWWLRSPGYYSKRAVGVHYDGEIVDFGNYVLDSSGCVRPALWIEI